MRVRYKPWALEYLKNSEFAYEFFPKNNNFKKIKIEIGGGKGDFIVDRSINEPDIFFLMIERVISIAAVAAKKIAEKKINNVNIIYNNFEKIDKDIENESIETIYLNFPDPWPKKKHEKRRITSKKFLECYYRILKKNGEIIFKTDQKNLYEYTKKMLNEQKFIIYSDDLNYQELCNNDSLTEYEQKFRAKNQNIFRLIIKKK